MAKVCEICKKSTVFGNRDRHHHAKGWEHRAPNRLHKTNPNLRNAKVKIDGKEQKVKLCMKCYKTMGKKGLLV